MAWANALITNNGLSVLSALLLGGEMIIDTAMIGSTTVDDIALMSQTDIASPITDVPVVIASSKKVDNGIEIKLQIRNTGVAAPRVFKQIGLYALYNGERKLFAIAQNIIGEEVPSENSYPDYMLEFTMALAVSQTEGITVTINPSIVVTAEELTDVLKAYVTKAELCNIPKLYHTEDQPTESGPWIWLQAVRTREIGTETILLLLSNDEPQNGDVIVQMDGIEYTVDNASTNPEDVGEGEYLFDINN